MRHLTHTLILLVLSALFIPAAIASEKTLAKSKSTRLRDILAKERKAFLISRMRGIPEPRELGVYQAYIIRKETERATSARLD